MLRRFSDVSALPLALALQGVALTLLALFSLSPDASESARVGTGDLPGSDRTMATELQIPRDLARERLPVPKFPKLDEPGENEAPEPDPGKEKAPIAPGEKLAALRVSSVALAGLVSMDSPTRIPDAPDVLGLHDIGGSFGRSWLGGDRRTSRGNGGFMGPSDTGDDGSGWGGIGIGGHGYGRDGDRCMPGRRGLIGRPRSPGRSGSPGGTPAGPVGGSGGGGGAGGSGARNSGDRPSRGGSKS